MSTINITNARKDIYNLVEAVNRFHEPALTIIYILQKVVKQDEKDLKKHLRCREKLLGTFGNKMIKDKKIRKPQFIRIPKY